MFVLVLMGFMITTNAQKIAKVKIEDVVKSYSANNDTVYVVSFWATFCKPCNAEIPDFIKIVEKYKSQKVKLLLVSLDLPTYYPEKIKAFAVKNNYKTNIAWLDETNADHFCPLIDQKWSGAIPSTIIVNNKTGYRKFVEDQITAEDFEASIKEAIGGSAANKYLAPMTDAEVLKVSGAEVTVENPSIRFKSNDSAVYSVAGGKIKMIAKIDDMKVMIVENSGMFYTYSNLGSTAIKTGDEVKANQLLGYAALDLDGDKPSVDFYVSNAAGNFFLEKDFFAQRKDSKQTEHSFDPRLNSPTMVIPRKQ